MPSIKQPPPARNEGNEFSQKCHYVRKQYDCQHQIWTRSHRVVHVGRCQHAPASKARCGNMASRPKLVATSGMCSKCRPVALGVGAGGKLAHFEMLVPRNNDGRGGGGGCGDCGAKSGEPTERQEHFKPRMVPVAGDRKPGGAIPISYARIPSNLPPTKTHTKHEGKRIPSPQIQTQTQTEAQNLNRSATGRDSSKEVLISKSHISGTAEAQDKAGYFDWEALSESHSDSDSGLDPSPLEQRRDEDWIYVST